MELSHGGWLGLDGKNRTNYCGFPLVPLVVADKARHHFIVAIALLSDESKWRVARAVRLFTLWLQTRFAVLVVNHPTIQLGGPPEDDDDDEPHDDQVDLATELLVGLDACHLLHGTRDPLADGLHYLGLLPDRAIAFRNACADNADGYGWVLSASGAKPGNDPCHMLRAVYVPHKGLWKSIAADVHRNRGGSLPSQNDISYILAWLKFLIIIPPVRWDPLGDSDNDTLFHTGVQLFLGLMRDSHFTTFANHFETQYTGLVVHRRGNWGHCCFPPFCPHHTSGVESMNAIIEKFLKGHHFKEVVLFAAEIRGFLHTMARQYQSDGHTFQQVPRVFNDVKTWKRAFALTGNKQLMTVEQGGYMMRFGRPANGTRWLVPSKALIKACESATAEYAEVVRTLRSMANTYIALIRDPAEYGRVNPNLDHYIRWVVRSFYVLHDLGLENRIHPCMSATCSCPFFLKKWFCKHAICLFFREHSDLVPVNMVRPHTPWIATHTIPTDMHTLQMVGQFPRRRRLQPRAARNEEPWSRNVRMGSYFEDVVLDRPFEEGDLHPDLFDENEGGSDASSGSDDSDADN